jgi:hypothetical protein
VSTRTTIVLSTPYENRPPSLLAVSRQPSRPRPRPRRLAVTAGRRA